MITGYQRQTRNRATMRDDDLRRHVAAELSWDPQVDSEAIEVSALIVAPFHVWRWYPVITGFSQGKTAWPARRAPHP